MKQRNRKLRQDQPQALTVVYEALWLVALGACLWGMAMLAWPAQ